MPEKISALTSNYYPKKSAGKLMTYDIPLVKPDFTVKQMQLQLKKNSHDYATLDYIYVVEDSHLLGIISIKELFRRKTTTKASSIMKKDIVSTHPYTSAEKATHTALQKKIKAIPIIDKEGVFLGVITHDTLLTTAYNEATEDLFKFTGIDAEVNQTGDILDISLMHSLKQRLPWLLLGLLGGIGISRIIGHYEETLKTSLILATFIPLFVYMSNAVGQQIMAYTIRDYALRGEIDIARFLPKHASIVAVISAIIGSIVYLYGLVVYNDPQIALVLGVSMFATIMSSVISGFLIPYVFIKTKADPADASGPIGTVIQDTLSVIIYFAVASFILKL